MIIQYAHYLKQKARQAGIDQPLIQVDSRAGLNGRPSQQLVDPTVNLAEEPMRLLAPAPWIVPLERELLVEAE
jgi:hypothetical protein